MASDRSAGKHRTICVREEFKIAVKLALDKFRFDENQKVLEFPSSFTAVERAYVHRFCQGLGLNSKSRGRGTNRFLTVTKKDISSSSYSSALSLTSNTCQLTDSLFKRFPLNSKERLELQPKTERSTSAFDIGRGSRDGKFGGKLSGGTPQVPPPHRTNELTSFRQELPIFSLREHLLKLISEFPVVLVSGETGSGKTTQVPQYILEQATEMASCCRVVCTQPRRISAISVAERVAGERGERLGQVVGYQIRLESRVSPRTLLMYCTNGVLLRALMSGDSSLSSVTHVIVDEIHERDKFSDFLLISLRDLLAVNKKLKLVLMSAALDINLFREYFGDCPVLHVPGRCHEVKANFLEDVLKITSYTNKEMEKHLKASLVRKTGDGAKNDAEQLLPSAPSGAGTGASDTTDAEPAGRATDGLPQQSAEDGDNDGGDADDVFGGQTRPHQESEPCDEDEARAAVNSQEDFEPEFVLDEDMEEEELLPAEGETPPQEEADVMLEGEEEDGDEEQEAEEEVEGEEGEQEEGEEEAEEGQEEQDEGEEDPGDGEPEEDGEPSVRDLEEGFGSVKLEEEGMADPGGMSTKQQENLDEEDELLKQEMDSSISEAWLKGDEETFVQILHLIMNEDISVDYQHSETQATALMVASGRGCLGVVEQLLALGANPHIREPKNGWTALDWAKKCEHGETVEYLESFMSSPGAPFVEEAVLQNETDRLNDEERELLSVYHKTFDDDRVDLDLICSLLRHVCGLPEPGSILVFLPGYDEIISLRDRLFGDREFGNNRRYQVFVLHSSLQPSDQRKVFRKLPPTVRKIILSTNIAETSITIDDVVYVIDSGKVKEKSFDALTSVSMLQSVWVSKASAIQRRGRAGRCAPGKCFHLFSRVRFESFQEYQIPELLRVPLQELCLHAKLLTGPNTQIADFLAKAPEPPAYLVLRNAVTLLKTIDALDKWEDLTDIGRHLADLPVEPRLGKMVLYSLVLKCLDPILTIVCALAYRNPFVLPLYPAEKRAAALAKRRFVLDAFSDHLLFVRVFSGWQRARAEGYDKNFCRKNFLSQATLETMAGMRSQLLGQLKSAGFVRARGAGDIRDINSNSNNWAVVKAVLCAGIYPQVARLDRSVNKLATQREKKVRLHNSSVFYRSPERGESVASAQVKTLSALPSDWLLYEEMTRMYTTVTVKCCTVVSSLSVALFTGPSLSSEILDSDPSMSRDERRSAEGLGRDSSSDSENEDKMSQEPGKDQAILKIDEWISLSGRNGFVKLASFLRHKLQALFVRRIRSPSRPWSQVDEAVVRAVVAALTSEEQAINPSLYPPQKRRTGFEMAQDRSGRLDRVRAPAERFSPSKERPRDSNGAALRAKAESGPAQQDAGGRRLVEAPSPRPTQSADRFSDGRYFIMKCNNQRNLDISMAKGIWATTLANEKKLNRAYKECKRVYLVFSVQGSGHFQGYAEMTSPIGKDKSPEFGSSSLSGVFTVNWIKKANIPFQQVHLLVNPWNDNKKVQISRDGQELEPSVGAELCKVWDSLEAAASSGRFSRAPNNNARRGKPAGPSDAAPPHWAASPAYAGQQVYVPHAASMPIPVPVPSRHAIPQTYSRRVMPAAAQPMALRPQSPVQFGGQPVNFQPHMRPPPQRYAGSVVQPLNIRTPGVPPGMRPAFTSPRK